MKEDDGVSVVMELMILEKSQKMLILLLFQECSEGGERGEGTGEKRIMCLSVLSNHLLDPKPFFFYFRSGPLNSV